jgi:hypothetical protein
MDKNTEELYESLLVELSEWLATNSSFSHASWYDENGFYVQLHLEKDDFVIDRFIEAMDFADEIELHIFPTWDTVISSAVDEDDGTSFFEIWFYQD